MKDLFLAITATILMTGCRHEPQPKPEPPTWTIEHIPGNWKYEDGREITIRPQTATSFPVIFPKQIHSPVTGPITIEYRYSDGDTVWLWSGNIYPDCYFYMENGQVKGMMKEYREQPGKGEYVPISKE